MKLPGEKSQRRSPFFYLIGGFLSGIVVARNAHQMSNPDQGAILIGILLLVWIALRAGKRQVAEASAVAVATAISHAKAEAQAAATATATQAVQIVLTRNGIDYDARKDIVGQTFEQIERSTSYDYDIDEAEQAEFDYQSSTS